MRNLTSGLILGLWLVGIGFFVIGVVLGSVYSDEDKVLNYTNSTCLITDHIIGKLNICETKNGYEDFYMAVWNVTVGGKEGVTTVLLPDSRYENKTLAIKDIKNGPRIGTVVDCMCPSVTSNYPSLNDDNDIDCDVWKACLLGVDTVQSQQIKIINYRKAGEVMFYIGISIEAILVVFVFVFVVFCMDARD